MLSASAALMVLAAGCTPTEPDASATAAPTATVASPDASAAPSAFAELPLWVVVMGDSNSTGFTSTLADGIDAGTAWIAMVPQTQIKFAGGWAHNGATAADMLLHAAPAPDADAVVIMAGTNDIARSTPTPDFDANLRAIAATVGARQVVLSAIAPFDARSDDAIAMNGHLAALAIAEGWTFIDPWRSLRAEDGTWVPQFHRDGLHTIQEGYQVMALSLRDQVLAALAPGSLDSPTG